MNCKEFQERMYLRDDELDAHDRAELERHRSGCRQCASEYARVEISRTRIRDLKGAIPVMSDPLMTINAVIARIEHEGERRQSDARVSLFDRWIVHLSAPAIRTAMAGLLLLITGAFAAEYTWGFVRMKGFEESIDRKSLMHEDLHAARMADQMRLVNAAAELSSLIFGKPSTFELSENWVVMNKESFEEFIRLYDELKDSTSSLSPEFRAEHPELSTLLETKRQSVPLDALLKERASLIRELNRMLTKGK